MNSSPYPTLTIEHALLGFLRQLPMHGYEIYQRLSEADELRAVWHLKQSYLYALLAKLKKEGLITTVLQTQGARPARQVFHLTPAGEKNFLDWVKSPVVHGRELRLDFLVKFYFARREGGEVVQSLLDQQQIACENWLARQQMIADNLADRQSYEWLVNQFRIGQIEAMLVWLHSCKQTVAEVQLLERS